MKSKEEGNVPKRLGEENKMLCFDSIFLLFLIFTYYWIDWLSYCCRRLLSFLFVFEFYQCLNTMLELLYGISWFASRFFLCMMVTIFFLEFLFQTMVWWLLSFFRPPFCLLLLFFYREEIRVSGEGILFCLLQKKSKW